MESIKTIPAKTVVTRTKSSAWFGADYNMNIYRGCSHGCIYCDSRSECYRNDAFHEVTVKENVLAIIEKELRSKQQKGVVATGSMSDPYNPQEKRLQLTRQALHLLQKYGFGVAIATKGALVGRDVDVLQGIRGQSPVLVKITVTTPSDAMSKRIEPHAPPSSMRLAALRKLSENGIYTGILLMPMLPYITDTNNDLQELIRKAQDCGAKFIYPSFGVTLRDRQREYYYTQLDAEFPGLRGRYVRQYGGQYACGSPHAKALQATFREACEKAGLLYRMQDIISAYRRPYAQKQTSLFDLVNPS